MTEGNEGAKSFEFVIFKFLAEKKWKPGTFAIIFSMYLW